MSFLHPMLRWFLPEDERFFDHLDAAAAAADEAARRLVELIAGSSTQPVSELVQRIRQSEHDGDAAMRAMTDALDQTFVTPLDREDLFRLCNQLEAVSDFVAATASQVEIHQLRAPPPGADELATLLARATADLVTAVAGLRERPTSGERVRTACRAVRSVEHDADLRFRKRVAELFDREKDAIRLIQHKEFLEGLENAVDACAAAASTLEGVLIKHG